MEGERADNPEDLFLNLVVNMFCPFSSDWPTWSFFISESFIFCYQEFILNINECMCGRQNDKIWGRVGVCVCITPPHTHHHHHHPKSYGHWEILLKDRGLFVGEVII